MKQPSKERGCEGKMKLTSAGKIDKAWKMALKHKKRYGVYACPHCNYYHLTTKLDNVHLYEPLVYITPPIK